MSEWVDGYGYAAPLAVSTPEAEYKAVREAVGALDFSMLYKVDVEGKGALELVNSLVARDLRSLPQGRIAYSAIVDENGMMVDDVTSIVFSSEFVRVTGGTARLEELLRELAGAEIRSLNAGPRSATCASRVPAVGSFYRPSPTKTSRMRPSPTTRTSPTWSFRASCSSEPARLYSRAGLRGVGRCRRARCLGRPLRCR